MAQRKQQDYQPIVIDVAVYCDDCQSARIAQCTQLTVSYKRRRSTNVSSAVGSGTKQTFNEAYPAGAQTKTHLPGKLTRIYTSACVCVCVIMPT